MEKRYEIKVTGRVQGVGFRYFTQRHAAMLGLKGWVKNTVDGNVLVVVQGDETDVNTFIDYLLIGPPLSKVTGIFKVEMPVSENPATFGVKY